MKTHRVLSLLAPAFALGLAPLLAGAPAGQPDPPFQRVVIDEDPPSQPYYKMVGDLTGDGKLEIVIAGRVGPLVMYSRPDWKKTLIAERGYDGGVNGELADINGNGKLDIVMGGVVWFENPGWSDGRWQGEWKMHRIDNQRIHDVEVADLTGDGRLDVVCRDQSAFGARGNQVFVYYQHEPNSWKKEVLSCPHGEGLKVADVDGDGRPDIVIGAIWFKNGAGSWTEHVYAPEWTEPDTKVEVGDINGNGRPDIVLTPAELKGERYRISWFEAPAGDRTQPWKEHVIVPDVECVVHALALADFDRDGQLDVAYAVMHQGTPPNEVVVMLNRDQGARWEKLVLDTQGSHDIVAADLTGNGAPDLVGANHAGVHPVILWQNQLGAKAGKVDNNPDARSLRGASPATLPLDRWRRHVIDDQRPWRAVFIDAADLDGDGHADIITGGWWYRNPGTAAGAWERREIGEPLRNMAVVFDFDGDGRPDILGTEGRGSEASDQFVWARNDGDGQFTILRNIQRASGDFLQGSVAARFQRDGPIEVALSWHRAGHGVQMLTVPRDPAQDTWTWRKISDFSQDEAVSAGDIDGSGRLDLLLGTRWLRNAGDAWTLHTLHAGPGDPDRNRLADVNGNGRLDAVVGFEAISRPGKLAWYEQPDRPDAPWTEHVISTDVVGPMSLDVADMNGSGALDVVVGEHNLREPATARLYVFENVRGDGSEWVPHVVHVGDEHHDGAIVVDIDGDGDLDIISIGWSHPRVLLYENLAVQRADQ